MINHNSEYVLNVILFAGLEMEQNKIKIVMIFFSILCPLFKVSLEASIYWLLQISIISFIQNGTDSIGWVFFHKTCLILAPFISMSSLVCCKITIFLNNDLFVLFFLFVYFIYFSRLFPFPIYLEVPYYAILDISIMHSDMVVPCP